MENYKKIESNWKLLLELRKLNPAVQFDTNADITHISIDCAPEELILPPPFYYNVKNGITNKGQTPDGTYIALPVW